MTSSLPVQLRADLQLLEGAPDADGFPHWLIYDPARHKYFLIGWMEFEILSRWQTNDVIKIIEDTNKKTTLNINEQHIQQVVDFLYENELTESPNDISQLLSKNKKVSFTNNLLHSYLFLMIPLLKPDKFLSKTLPFIKALFFAKRSLYIFIVITLLGLYFTSHQWDEFINTFDYMFSFENVMIFTLSIIFIKIIHELGHAYIAKYYGCHVSTIGVAFLVMWPVMYTDTTDVWKLKNKNQRLLIAAGGMISELILASLATFLWNFAPAGILKSTLFFIASVSWISSVLININPLLRFDGYYLFSDFIGIDNLQSTAFTLGKWKLREYLFRFNESAPITYPKDKEKILLFYAYFTWIYRFFLFLSIALLVYLFFFKVLGIILMLVEILFFIAIPIIHELKNYWLRREHLTMNKNTIITFSTLFLIILLFTIPWHTDIRTPAILEYSQQTKIFTKTNGVITKINYQSGKTVERNQLLIQLANPDITHQLQQTNIDLEIINIRLRQEKDKSSELGFKQANIEELQALKNKKKSLLQEQEKLAIYAPFSGKYFAESQAYKKGVWLDKNAMIGELLVNHTPSILAYISEEDLYRIKVGAKAIFYPDESNGQKLYLKVTQIDNAATELLPSPYLSSIYGGDIASSQQQQNKIAVEEALYRVKFSIEGQKISHSSIVRGSVIIKGKRESYIKRIWQLISAVLIRESMF